MILQVEITDIVSLLIISDCFFTSFALFLFFTLISVTTGTIRQYLDSTEVESR